MIFTTLFPRAIYPVVCLLALGADLKLDTLGHAYFYEELDARRLVSNYVPPNDQDPPQRPEVSFAAPLPSLHS